MYTDLREPIEMNILHIVHIKIFFKVSQQNVISLLILNLIETSFQFLVCTV